MKKLGKRVLCCAAFLAAFSAAPPHASAAAVPHPLATPHLPDKPLHVTLIVEVNKKGQVVRVNHGSLSGDRAFDTMMIGNAMQMWIRHPNGSAETGLYRVNYDYNPRTHDVQRIPALIKAGGAWANKAGAATLIIKDAQHQEHLVEARLRAQQAAKERARGKNLPNINAAVKRATKKRPPTPRP